MTAAKRKVVPLSDVREPMVPPGTRVGGDYMPLYCKAVLNSEALVEMSPAARWAGLRLWMHAWMSEHTTGTLPNNEKLLAEYAGYAGDKRGWERVRDGAMHKFQLCSDGRLHHPTLAAAVHSLLERRAKANKRKQDERDRKADADIIAAKAPQDDGENADKTRDNIRVLPKRDGQNQGVSGSGHASVPREGKGREGKDKSSVPYGTGAQAPLPLPVDARTLLFHPEGKGGLAIVRRLIGKGEGASRAFIGKLLKECQDDASAAHGILLAANDLNPADPASWIAASAKARGNAQATKPARSGGLMAKIHALGPDTAATPSPADDRVIDGECEDVEL